MATFNGARYIREQLDSLARQVRLPDELLICDDSSEDDTRQLIKEFSSSAPFPVHLVVNDTNLGFTKTFTHALSYSTGDLLFFSDQDDYWLPEKIECLECLFAANGKKLLAIAHDGKLVTETLEWKGATKLCQVRGIWAKDEYLVTGALTAIRRELLTYMLPIPEGVKYDSWMHGVARALGARLVHDHSLQLIRRHSSTVTTGQTSSTTPVRAIDAILKNLRWHSTEYYQRELYFIRTLVVRILVIGRDSECPFAKDLLRMSVEELHNEEKAVAGRLRMLSVDPIRRRLIAIKLYSQGQYRMTSGLRGFLGDLLGERH